MFTAQHYGWDVEAYAVDLVFDSPFAQQREKRTLVLGPVALALLVGVQHQRTEELGRRLFV
jgi:hypothetical protein